MAPTNPTNPKTVENDAEKVVGRYWRFWPKRPTEATKSAEDDWEIKGARPKTTRATTPAESEHKYHNVLVGG